MHESITITELIQYLKVRNPLGRLCIPISTQNKAIRSVGCKALVICQNFHTHNIFLMRLYYFRDMKNNNISIFEDMGHSNLN